MWLLAQNGVGSAVGRMIVLLISTTIAGAAVGGLVKIFEKAGKPGWAAIIPIYNLVVLLEICGRPRWWILLLLIPGVGFVVGLVVCVDVARSFGKSESYGFGLAFLGFIFIPMLGFGGDRYVGPAAAGR